MHLQWIKIRLTILVGSLLLIGMGLLNLVLVILWQNDALQREIRRDMAVLDRILERLPNEPANLRGLPPDSLLFANLYPAGETGRILLITKTPGAGNTGSSVSENTFPNLDQTVAEAISTGRMVFHYPRSFPAMFNVHHQVLVIAQPIIRNGDVVGGVGILRSLRPMFQTLWQAEKIALGYLFINLVLLTVISFFRMKKLVTRPIERLVRLADRYNDQESLLFSVETGSGEFSRLAFSLNNMLTRIENDKKALAENVQQLESVNQKLKDQQQEMIRAEKMASVGRMASGLAHEIGNPIGVVQGYLDLLGKTNRLDEQHRDFIQRADQELQRINMLIRQMLDFARISTGPLQSCSINGLLRSIMEMMQVQPAFKNISLKSRLEATQDKVRADHDQLRQVFVNCLLNSADAVAEARRNGGGLIEVVTQVVTARSNATDNMIRIRISDNGAGIAPEHLDNIFDPFYTTKDTGKGTGLGLSVSLSIIEALGGRMQMKSKKGEGSTLSVFLPLQQFKKGR